MSNRRARLWAGIVVLCALCLSGCGGDDEEPAAAPGSAYETVTGDPEAPPADEPPPTTTASALPAPCDLVTKKEAEKLAGTPVAAPAKGPESCTFTGPPDGPLGQFELYLGDGAKKFLDIDVQLDHEFTGLPDVGDEALLEDGAVFFRVGETWVALKVTRLDDPHLYRDDLVELAGTVAGRL